MPVQEPDPQSPVALFIAALLAALAHFSRMLRRGWPGYLRLVAGMTGASVAGVVFGSAAIALHPEPVPSELIWAIGGAVGWLGGDVMDTIARFFLRKMGVEEREKP